MKKSHFLTINIEICKYFDDFLFDQYQLDIVEKFTEICDTHGFDQNQMLIEFFDLDKFFYRIEHLPDADEKIELMFQDLNLFVDIYENIYLRFIKSICLN